jgi:antitoxin component of MazEF toxin-antitoxin module
LIVEAAWPNRRLHRSSGALIEGMTPESDRSEVEWSPPVGNEAW